MELEHDLILSLRANHKVLLWLQCIGCCCLSVAPVLAEIPVVSCANLGLSDVFSTYRGARLSAMLCLE